MPAGGAGDAAEDVAAADHQADLHAHRRDVADVGGDGAHLIVVEAIVPPRHQRLAGDLQQDALIDWRVWHGRLDRRPRVAGSYNGRVSR